ncbi:MAG: hypothetical protein KAT71_04215, partial [Gammaproteobacteria bacterium]|nr:hypothetical protein [Gammaproteobacteria bacterium]
DRGGKAILTGVHLENPAMHSEYQPIRDQIDQTTLVREYVLSRLLQRLGVQLNSRYEASALAQSQPASSTNNFIAIYKVELKPQQVGQYEQCWKQISDYLINRRGALCSIIAEPENTMGADDRQLRTIISFWPSKEARDQAWPKDKTKIDKEIQAASEQMTTCRFPDSEVIQEGATIHRTNIPEQLSSQIQAIISLETGHHYTSNMQPAFFQQKPTEGGRGPDSHLKITDPVIDSTMRHESAARPRPPQ